MNGMMGKLLLGSVLAWASMASPFAATMVTNFDVTGIFSNDGFGSPTNEVFNINVGSNSQITGIGWEVELSAVAPSFLSEIALMFGSSSNSFVQLRPGVGDNNSGNQAYSSGGITDLIGLGIDFSVLADGLLRLEFFETFDNVANAADGRWISGQVSVRYETNANPVPEPATSGMMLAGLVVAGMVLRRRQRLSKRSL